MASSKIKIAKSKIGETEQVAFSVDSGILYRLGLELFQRAESAVAELIKNAYAADANNVEVTFIEVEEKGGTLIIEDDGEGMTRDQLINGFMRIASTEKLHNPFTTKERKKAGKKGIGRFATIFLGTKITIETNNNADEIAYQLEIDWEKYKIDSEVTKVENTLETIEKTKPKGTTVTIHNLRESWSEKDVKRVYRYVADLLQPNIYEFNKNKKSKNKLKEVKETDTFEVRFYDKENSKPIVDINTMMYDNALAKITAYIDENGYGYCSVKSEKFGLSGKEFLKISDTDKDREKHEPFQSLKGTSIILIAYYFIYDRIQYYQDGFTSPELTTILNYLKKDGGIKLYRNRFRLPNYGGNNDWLSINKKSREKEVDGVPFSTKNIIGYVQLTDENDVEFDETAGRESLIEKDAFNALKRFAQSSLIKAIETFKIELRNSSEFQDINSGGSENDTNPSDLKNSIAKVVESADILTSDKTTKKDKAKANKKMKKDTSKIIKQAKAMSDELEMLRVLAGVGLTIGEFTHEIKQFAPSLKGTIDWLISNSKKIGKNIVEKLEGLKKTFASLQTYTAYFDETISQNIIRELEPIDLKDVVNDFEKIAGPDLIRKGIELKIQPIGNHIITAPMHRTEWNTILQNLYSNSKKAIRRSGQENGKIYIEFFKNKKYVLLQFMDDGDGIPNENKEKIFEAFFTTSTPVGSSNTLSDEYTGSGLGLNILKKIIENRNGDIYIDEPKEDYKTCITIKLPLVTEKQLEQYGY